MQLNCSIHVRSNPWCKWSAPSIKLINPWPQEENEDREMEEEEEEVISKSEKKKKKESSSKDQSSSSSHRDKSSASSSSSSHKSHKKVWIASLNNQRAINCQSHCPETKKWSIFSNRIRNVIKNLLHRRGTNTKIRPLAAKRVKVVIGKQGIKVTILATEGSIQFLNMWTQSSAFFSGKRIEIRPEAETKTNRPSHLRLKAAPVIKRKVVPPHPAKILRLLRPPRVVLRPRRKVVRARKGFIKRTWAFCLRWALAGIATASRTVITGNSYTVRSFFSKTTNII